MSTAKRVAVVTGASSGIGAAAASALLDAGFEVVGTSRSAAGLRADGGVALIDLDVTSEVSVAAAVGQVVERFGRIDVLVNNAGIGASGAAEDSSVDLDRRLFEVNVFGVMRTTKAVLPHMRARASGRIVNISSVLGLVPQPYMAAYASTKWAIEGWTESLDHEVREHGIRAVMVEPAWTNTGFEANALDADQPKPAYAAQRKIFAEYVGDALERGDAPSVVAASIVRAAQDPTPKLRYGAGKRVAPISLMRRYVPHSAFDRQIRKLNRLPQ
ncbi:oxidoreductase [Sinomonas sp.]|uniref:oxidoreductase n=1 Tax=Sinomonas sp. TaxID=1914986 RepID=UPI002BAD5BA9|nr:oxidoreductase [Sinomonas sp.]